MLKDHPELFTEFGHLFEKLQAGVHFPPARSESRLLPLLPETTVFYAAIPNYGDAAQQALDIFRSELQQSSALREWWRKGNLPASGTTLEDSLETFHRLSQYLGDEIVLSANIDRSAANMLLVAPMKKPGVKIALKQLLTDVASKSKSKPGVRILDPQELAGAEDMSPGQDIVVLVRPDYLVAAANIGTLRGFSNRLDANTRGFTATGFGQRVARAYQDGITVVGAADLHTILNQALPENKPERTTLQRTGFADVQYMVWEHTNIGGQDISQTEVSFTGPRRGIASWLGAPSQLGSLDFASPKALMAMSFVLSNPAQVFDDLRALATADNPNGFASVTKMEQDLKVSLQQDLLRMLGGEVTIEVDSIAQAGAVWKAILKTNDPVRLQQTITTLLASQKLTPERLPGRDAIYTVSVPSGKTPTEYAYAFVDGYLVIASSPDAARDALQLHRSGESLAKSQRFLASLPAGHPSGVSALMYQDPLAMAALQMQQIAPDMAAPLAQLSAQSSSPTVMVAYAEENAVRSASTSTTMDVGVVLAGAAIAIPNLLRSRVAANEASAVGSMRTLNVAQITYASTYPDHGYAPNLEALGPAPGNATAYSPEHAGLIDASLGCSGGGWCEKSGFRFRMTAVCMQQQCPQYVAVAAPANAGSGNRNFCSTSDGVIRYKLGPPVTAPIRVVECRNWQPLR